MRCCEGESVSLRYEVVDTHVGLCSHITQFNYCLFTFYFIINLNTKDEDCNVQQVTNYIIR